MRIAFILCLCLVSACATSDRTVLDLPDIEESSPGNADLSFSILSINDVYRIDGLASSGAGGLDRLRAIRAAVEKDHPNLLFLHGGDLLYPSFMSRLFDGTQMIDILNMMDGDDGSFDDRMFVVFGNHEFDQNSEEDVFGLQRHIFESQFNWLGSNIDFTSAMGTKISASNLQPTAMVTFGDLQVGLFGLVIGVDGVEYATFRSDTEYLKAQARSLSQDLRAAGADIVIGLTHLDIGVDEQLLRVSGGPDLIIGGHEHEALQREYNGKYVFKADADAETARLVHVTLPADGSAPIVEHSLLRIGAVEDPGLYEAVPPDPQVKARIEWWTKRTSAVFCNEIDLALDCLDDILAKAGSKLVAEELSIRGKETNVGNFIADLMAEAGRAHGDIPEGAPVVSFVNSGSLRLNQNILKNGLVNRQHIEELIQYDGPLFLIKISPDQLVEALGHSAECRISGAWLQMSGIRYTAHPNAGRATDVVVDGQPIGTEDIYAVTVQFVADPDFFGNQDGYTFRKENIVGILKDSDGSEIMLKELIYQGIDSLPVRDGFRDMNPQLDGRIQINMDSPGTPLCET
ncbi:MAG: bifunctional metallophosphatase/5'-nucleotidase [Rhodothermales bacterium]|nr:bifunctional metallophosphatase/5'-nucleotidase [Rhodothermales bacterium]